MMNLVRHDISTAFETGLSALRVRLTGIYILARSEFFPGIPFIFLARFSWKFELDVH